MNKRIWTAEALRQATGGAIQGNWTEARGVLIDSRKIQGGELFVALKGERVDGHDFVQDAIEKGASAAIVSRDWKGGNGLPILRVGDPESALRELAVMARSKSLAKILAVTGSVGKTSTKELLHLALSAHGETFATEGNLNNHLGVPLMLSNMPEDVKFAIFELGMNHAGEISALSDLVKPHLSIITAIEAVHLEFFPSIEGIASAKAEIFDGMEEGGIAVLNRDSAYFGQLEEEAKLHGVRHIFTFGVSEDAEARLIRYEADEDGSEITALIADMCVAYQLGSIGKQWAMASLAALTCVSALGLDLARSMAAIARFQEAGGRGNRIKLRLERGEAILIDDSYNASPASMEAAFLKLVEVHGRKRGRKIVALGDMLELGAKSAEAHRELMPALVRAGVDKVYASGMLMENLVKVLPPRILGMYGETPKELAERLLQDLRPGDTLLVKGSHGSKMHEVVQMLKHQKELVHAL